MLLHLLGYDFPFFHAAEGSVLTVRYDNLLRTILIIFAMFYTVPADLSNVKWILQDINNVAGLKSVPAAGVVAGIIDESGYRGWVITV